MKTRKFLLAALFSFTCLSTATIHVNATEIPEATEEITEYENESDIETTQGKGQMTFIADIPDGFGLNLYVNVWNYDTGEEYELYLYSTNNYTGHMALDEGTYMIGQVSVCDDNTSRYPVSWETDGETIDLAYNEVKTIHCKLCNEEEIIQQIKEKREKYGNKGIEEESIVEESEIVTSEETSAITEVEQAQAVEDSNNISLSTILFIIGGILIALIIGIYILYVVNIKSKNNVNDIFK